MNEFTEQTCPYPGARPFRRSDRDIFFGRERAIDEILSRLGERRFIALLGGAGSGKSSLVEAGILPALQGGLLTSAGSFWKVARVVPVGNPIARLAQALSEDAVLGDAYRGEEQESLRPEYSIEANLSGSPLGLTEAVRQAQLAKSDNLLIVVDDFQAFFGRRFRDKTARFVKLLLEAARQSEFPIYVIMVIRSSSFEKCSQYEGLPEAISESQFIVPRMSRDQLRATIMGPAAVKGFEVSAPLLTRLLNDQSDETGRLTGLQKALRGCWEKRQGDTAQEGPIDLPHYKRSWNWIPAGLFQAPVGPPLRFAGAGLLIMLMGGLVGNLINVVRADSGDGLSAKLAATETELNAKERTLDATNGELTTTSTELIATKTKLATTMTEFASIRAELATTITELTAKSTELITTKTELVKTRTELVTTETELATTRTELRELATTKTELATTRTALTAMNGELAVTKSALDLCLGKSGIPVETVRVLEDLRIEHLGGSEFTWRADPSHQPAADSMPMPPSNADIPMVLVPGDPPFLMATREMTRAQWDAFRTECLSTGGSSPSAPLSNVNWLDAYGFCLERGLELPTEEQWMRALELEGELGLLHMDGNVSEWCRLPGELGASSLRSQLEGVDQEQPALGRSYLFHQASRRMFHKQTKLTDIGFRPCKSLPGLETTTVRE